MSVEVTKSEIRAVLVRHWRALDRARLHTMHFWLLIYSAAQLFVVYYFTDVNVVGQFSLRTDQNIQILLIANRNYTESQANRDMVGPQNMTHLFWEAIGDQYISCAHIECQKNLREIRVGNCDL